MVGMWWHWGMRQSIRNPSKFTKGFLMTFLPKIFIPSVSMVDSLLRIILLIYPILVFMIRGGVNGSLFLITVISFWLLIADRKSNNKLFDKTLTAFATAMSSGLIAILISQLYHQDLSARYFDSVRPFLAGCADFAGIAQCAHNNTFRDSVCISSWSNCCIIGSHGVRSISQI